MKYRYLKGWVYLLNSQLRITDAAPHRSLQPSPALPPYSTHTNFHLLLVLPNSSLVPLPPAVYSCCCGYYNFNSVLNWTNLHFFWSRWMFCISVSLRVQLFLYMYNRKFCFLKSFTTVTLICKAKIIVYNSHFENSLYCTITQHCDLRGNKNAQIYFVMCFAYSSFI